MAHYAKEISLVRNDYHLISGGVVEAECGLGIGFHIGFSAALVTLFSSSGTLQLSTHWERILRIGYDVERHKRRTRREHVRVEDDHCLSNGH